MKRFLVFSYSRYYPFGGWNDFDSSFDSLEEAEAYIKTLDVDLCHIVDMETGEKCE